MLRIPASPEPSEEKLLWRAVAKGPAGCRVIKSREGVHMHSAREAHAGERPALRVHLDLSINKAGGRKMLEERAEGRKRCRGRLGSVV